MQKLNKEKTNEKNAPAERRGFLKKIAGLALATTAFGGITNLFAKKPGSETTAAFGPEAYIGSIAMFAGNFAPQNWALCNGQLIAISQNQALFSIIGTTYGGDGRTTFALPDLRGRVPINWGTGPGLTDRRLGQFSGQEYHTLTQTEMPSHTHIAQYTAPAFTGLVKPGAKTGRGAKVTDPTGAFMSTAPASTEIYSTTSDAQMGESPVTITESSPGNVVIGNSGNSQGHNNMQPWLCVNFIICLFGVYPPRS